MAWDEALEFAVQHLQDAVLSRAIKGVPIPHYYQGKKVGEHRRYDERLAQFLLRTRKPALYGRRAEAVDIAAPPELYAIALARAILGLEREAGGRDALMERLAGLADDEGAMPPDGA